MVFSTLYSRHAAKGVTFSKTSMTEQAHKNDYDINRLVKRFTSSGVLATADQIRSVYYGDFSQVGQCFDNHLRILEAEEHFMALPSEVRAHFKNDPRLLLAALSDDSEGNVQKLVELGLVKETRLQQPVQQQQQPVQQQQ